MEEADAGQRRESVRAGRRRLRRWRGGARAGGEQALRQDRPADGRTGFLGEEAKSMSAPAMRAVECGALGDLSPQTGGGGGRSGSDAPDRRSASGTAVLRLAADDVRAE